MGEEYSDNIRLNDGAAFTMTVEGDFSKLYEALGIEVPKKNLYTDELKEACDAVVENLKNINRIMDQVMTDAVSKSPLVIRVKKEDIQNEDVLRQIKEQEIADLTWALDVVERNNNCSNSSHEFCSRRSCSKCEHFNKPGDSRKAINQLADYVKKSLNECENVVNRYIRNVTGGVELYDDAGQFVGYVHGFTDSGVTSSKETGAIIRSIVESSWGLLTLNPFTLEKIIEDHGYISDLHFILEMFKDYSDIKIPEHWNLVKRKTTEEK